jgi:hypothetical protein
MIIVPMSSCPALTPLRAWSPERRAAPAGHSTRETQAHRSVDILHKTGLIFMNYFLTIIIIIIITLRSGYPAIA